MAAKVLSAIYSLSSCSPTKTAIVLTSRPNFFRPTVSPKNTSISLSRLQISRRTVTVSKPAFHVPRVARLDDDNSELLDDDNSVLLPESEPTSASLPNINSGSNGSQTEATIDIKLPRRSLLVQFTCNSCGERTQRLVNRLAYERGTVFVQCTGCLQHHKLVDNLGLVVEYDLREDMGSESSDDQV
ncbi:hypothetical protein HHK36_024350 [Tetracentron sinense]|uniref:DNL-type domain-containing protein n=1 Tax=Tetracentron sinense TaxID=13715 RepID=A0A834YMP0_TETSI|nr:hypothetical protein HHK36_024350 [Tetracentron sinense]